MSIFNDDRRYSDDPDEYLAWREEAKWECRRDNYEPEDDLVVDLEEEVGVE